MAKITFPRGFLWGTSTAAHQIEGNNLNSDWWEWEQSKDYANGKNLKTQKNMPWPLEPSGLACDSYNRFEEDFELCKKLNNNSVRFSVEWARLEPQEGQFSEKEFEHYKKVIESAKSNGLKVFLTLHHFTSPLWFAKKGGWKNRSNVKYFSRYAKKCAEEFGDTVDFYSTINEPQIYAVMSFLAGKWCPQEHNPITQFLVQLNLYKAHNEAYKAIKQVDEKYKVGLIHNVQWYETTSRKLFFWDHVACNVMNYLIGSFPFDCTKKQLDFIGLNYYFTDRIKNLLPANANDWNSDLNWWIYPKGLYNVLIGLKKYKVPIYITENGVADKDDKHRERFIKEMLTSCHEAIQKGVDLRGYFYWSLLDNYEWHEGYWPRFGIVEIDRENNLKRNPRKSFYYYGEIALNNALDK